MRDLLAVVELAPSLPDARLQLGRALRQMGEFAAADIELAEGLTQAVAAHRPSHDAAHHPLHAALLLREHAGLRRISGPLFLLPWPTGCT